MLGLPLAFVAPLALAAFAALPLVWWLLRVTPPRPREVAFPPLILIRDLAPKEETPARTPWWILALRLLLVALIVLAMAGPIWNPVVIANASNGPALILLDDGWSAAPTWSQRITLAARHVEAAKTAGKPSAIVALSQGAREFLASDAISANERLRALKPQPFLPDRVSALASVEAFVAKNPGTNIIWIADGLAEGSACAFAEKLVAIGGPSTRIIADGPAPRALVDAANQGGALDVTVLRAAATGANNGFVRAVDMKGALIGQAAFDFAGKTEAHARFELPVELRNDIARLELVDGASAGAVALLDGRWRRRRVALVSGGTADTSQPLLSPSYYLTKALQPFADVREARAGTADPIVAMLDEKPAVLVLADIGSISGMAYTRLNQFVDEGGTLVRFAGARMANASDDLIPVRLRRGGRTLGGALSWETPKKLGAFDRTSPFNGLAVPTEVQVTRQVLAEPEAGLVNKTWAQLADGTPLVTGATIGRGRLVLFHVTADTTWSNLPLSGLFVDMLRKIVALSSASADGEATANGALAETLPPSRTLDGFGVFGAPPATARPLPVTYAGPPSLDHPPGFYGPVDGLRALNTLRDGERISAADFSGLKFTSEALNPAPPVDLRPPLMALAFLVFLLDALAMFYLSGAFRRHVARAALVLLMVCAAAPFMADVAPPAIAQEKSRTPKALAPRDLEAVLKTRLAYIVTGDERVDEASRLGLAALSRVLSERTSLLPGEPQGVDPARDELAFYPLIYWPVVAARPQPSPQAAAKVGAFMKQGGTIVFDTRDALLARPGAAPTPEAQWLAQFLKGMDVPELERVPRDHVVTKTFYLLDSFVGRTVIGDTWIEALPVEANDEQRPARSGDSVSPIVITSNDLASAWAATRGGDPLYPLVPGGARQRELALRGGVNLVMYTLTGNYKADQVHVRDLLERLGH